MLCPNISSPETRVPHRQHLDPSIFCLFHPGSSSSCPLAGICSFVVLSLLLAIFSGFSCPPRRPLRPCQDLDAACSPGLLSSSPPSKLPCAVPNFVCLCLRCFHRAPVPPCCWLLAGPTALQLLRTQWSLSQKGSALPRKPVTFYLQAPSLFRVLVVIGAHLLTSISKCQGRRVWR